MKFNSLFTHNVKSVLHSATVLYYVRLCKCFYKDSEWRQKIKKLRYSRHTYIEPKKEKNFAVFCFYSQIRLGFNLMLELFFPSFKDSYYDITLKVPTFLPAIISIPFRLLQHIYFPTMNVFLKILLRLWKFM